MSVLRYTIEDADGNEIGAPVFDEDEYPDAQAYAQSVQGRVICNEFEFSDSYMIDDYTDAGDDE